MELLFTDDLKKLSKKIDIKTYLENNNKIVLLLPTFESSLLNFQVFEEIASFKKDSILILSSYHLAYLAGDFKQTKQFSCLDYGPCSLDSIIAWAVTYYKNSYSTEIDKLKGLFFNSINAQNLMNQIHTPIKNFTSSLSFNKTNKNKEMIVCPGLQYIYSENPNLFKRNKNSIQSFLENGNVLVMFEKNKNLATLPFQKENILYKDFNQFCHSLSILKEQVAIFRQGFVGMSFKEDLCHFGWNEDIEKVLLHYLNFLAHKGFHITSTFILNSNFFFPPAIFENLQENFTQINEDVSFEQTIRKRCR